MQNTRAQQFFDNKTLKVFEKNLRAIAEQEEANDDYSGLLKGENLLECFVKSTSDQLISSLALIKNKTVFIASVSSGKKTLKFDITENIGKAHAMTEFPISKEVRTFH